MLLKGSFFLNKAPLFRFGAGAAPFFRVFFYNKRLSSFRLCKKKALVLYLRSFFHLFLKKISFCAQSSCLSSLFVGPVFTNFVLPSSSFSDFSFFYLLNLLK